MRYIRRTRRDRVLALLQARRNMWVPVYKLVREGGAQWQCRVLELRRSGHCILNRVEYRGGECLSWYQLCDADKTFPLGFRLVALIQVTTCPSRVPRPSGCGGAGHE